MARHTSPNNTRLTFRCWKLLCSGWAIAATANTTGLQRRVYSKARTRHHPNSATLPTAQSALATGRLARAISAKGMSATVANGGQGRPRNAAVSTVA
jgi:hypothetical protein